MRSEAKSDAVANQPPGSQVAEQVGLVAQLQQYSSLVGVVPRAEHAQQLRAQPATVPGTVFIIWTCAQVQAIWLFGSKDAGRGQPQRPGRQSKSQWQGGASRASLRVSP